MKTTMIRDATGKIYGATLTLTNAEALVIHRRDIPMIYSPGGVCLDAPENNKVRFLGARGANIEADTLAALESLKVAMQSALDDRAARELAVADELAGFEAFPSGGFADAMRGAKRLPEHVRCPFKRPNRIAAWKRGYAAAHDALMAA